MPAPTRPNIDVQSSEEQEQTLALLEILALGNREIEQGHYRNVNEVFADLEMLKTLHIVER